MNRKERRAELGMSAKTLAELEAKAVDAHRRWVAAVKELPSSNPQRIEEEAWGLAQVMANRQYGCLPAHIAAKTYETRIKSLERSTT